MDGPVPRGLVMSVIHSLTINVEGKSAAHLKKLLELALFELEELQESSWHKHEGDCLPLQMSGDLGSYRLEYKLGSQALIDAQAELIASGYRRTEVTDFRSNNYSVFEHDEKLPMRLYLKTALVVEHDVAEHEAGNIPF